MLCLVSALVLCDATSSGFFESILRLILCDAASNEFVEALQTLVPGAYFQHLPEVGNCPRLKHPSYHMRTKDKACALHMPNAL